MMTARIEDNAPLLGTLLADLAVVGPAEDRPVTGVTLDSRQVQPGDLFLACAGTRGHGATYIADAVAAGAAAVAVDRAGTPELPECPVPLIPVGDLAGRAGIIAARFYGDPSAAMALVGITGTNGKTSVSQFVAAALGESLPTAVMGTLGIGFPGDLHLTGHTTPDPVTLQAELARLLEAGARAVALEVSSHGLAQGRVSGAHFGTAVFTNLSRDHLDYHGDMAVYQQAKWRLFEMPGLRAAVINQDDAVGREWLEKLPAGVEALGYSASGADDAFLRAESVHCRVDGLQFSVESPRGSGKIRSPLLGRFNVDNLLAALGVLLVNGIAFDDAVARLGHLRPIAGRMELFRGSRGRVVVDYAHTPDALEQALGSLREHTAGRLWCVFGCGGERDRGKRPLMGAIAERLADHVVLTDDNPRREDPLDIIDGILGGMADPDGAYVQRDRAEAIRFALRNAGADDLILVAGKGHESEQQIGEQRLPFSDRKVVAELLEAADE